MKPFSKKTISKWLEALRSGKYRQAKEALSQDGGHCCLGVLCKVTGLEFKNLTPGRVEKGYNDNDLNHEVYEHLKGRLQATGLSATNLMQMNDGGNTFLEIAEHIQEVLNDKERRCIYTPIEIEAD